LRSPRGNDSAKHPAFFLTRELFDSSPIKKGLYGGRGHQRWPISPVELLLLSLV
jgi:hypothetical protein